MIYLKNIAFRIKRIDSWPRIDSFAWKCLNRINSRFLGVGIGPALLHFPHSAFVIPALLSLSQSLTRSDIPRSTRALILFLPPSRSVIALRGSRSISPQNYAEVCSWKLSLLSTVWNPPLVFIRAQDIFPPPGVRPRHREKAIRLRRLATTICSSLTPYSTVETGYKVGFGPRCRVRPIALFAYLPIQIICQTDMQIYLHLQIICRCTTISADTIDICRYNRYLPI